MPGHPRRPVRPAGAGRSGGVPLVRAANAGSRQRLDGGTGAARCHRLVRRGQAGRRCRPGRRRPRCGALRGSDRAGCGPVGVGAGARTGRADGDQPRPRARLGHLVHRAHRPREGVRRGDPARGLRHQPGRPGAGRGAGARAGGDRRPQRPRRSARVPDQRHPARRGLAVGRRVGDHRVRRLRGPGSQRRPGQRRPGQRRPGRPRPAGRLHRIGDRQRFRRRLAPGRGGPGCTGRPPDGRALLRAGGRRVRWPDPPRALGPAAADRTGPAAARRGTGRPADRDRRDLGPAGDFPRADRLGRPCHRVSPHRADHRPPGRGGLRQPGTVRRRPPGRRGIDQPGGGGWPVRGAERVRGRLTRRGRQRRRVAR